MEAKVRVSPVSKTAAILIVCLGVFMVVAGATIESELDLAAGVSFIALGSFLYWMLFRFNRKLERELKKATA